MCKAGSRLSFNLTEFALQFVSVFIQVSLVMSEEREKNVYFAKLAEQAERYDEMANYMKIVAESGGELTVEVS